MSTDQEGPKLRVHAGKYEELVITLVVTLQFALGAMVALGTLGFLYLTVGGMVSSTRTVTAYFGMVPFLIGITIVTYLLGLLLE